MDRYQHLRDLPFVVIAQALGIDLSKFKQRKSGTEWNGPCPVHRPKKNATSFSYASHGKWNCFGCLEHGREAIDLAIKVAGVGFQEAVRLLEPYADNAIQHQARAIPEPHVKAVVELPLENEAKKFTYEKHFLPSEWLQKRNLAPGTLERYGVGMYLNPSRQSAYKRKILIRLQRFSDGGPGCRG